MLPGRVLARRQNLFDPATAFGIQDWKLATTQMWLDVGPNEGSDPEICLAQVRELRDALLAQGWTSGKDFQYLEEPLAEHSEQAWGARIGNAFEFLFPVRTPEQTGPAFR